MSEADTTTPPPAAHPTSPTRSLRDRLRGRSAGRAALALFAFWSAGVGFGLQGWAWQATAQESGAGGLWVFATALQALLTGLPAALLAGWLRVPRYRAAFQGWIWAALCLLLLAPTRFWPPVQGQLIMATQFVVLAGAWWVVRSRVSYRPPLRPRQVALALALTALPVLPWWAVGAPGSPLDVALALLTSVAGGALAWSIYLATWLPVQRRDPRQPRRDRLTGGLVLAVTLLILGSGLGFNGLQLWIMAGLSVIAWPVIAAGAVAWAIGLALLPLLLLLDGDAFHLRVADPLLGVYLIALSLAVASGGLLGLLSLLPQPDPHRVLPRPLAWAGGVAGVALIAAVFVAGGRTAFHGDRLFVILRDQADLSQAAEIPDIPARRFRLYRQLTNHADRTQAALRHDLERFGIAHTPYYLVNGLEVEGGLLLRLLLQMRDDVATVLPSPELRPLPDWAAPLLTAALPEPLADEESLAQLHEAGLLTIEPDWNLTRIGARRVQTELGVSGRGIVVGIADSGVQFDHPELAANYRGRGGDHNFSWYDAWNGAPAPLDHLGHGTHVAGSAVGAQVGVAPGATWFACANLVRNLGNPARYLGCFQFMFAPFPLDGDPLRDGDTDRAAHVIGNSWGCPQEVEGCSPQFFAPALAALRLGGVFVVVAAGNTGPACASLTDPPATDAQVVSVGAVNRDGYPAPFSSAGPVTVDGSNRIKPDLLAPGVGVRSSIPPDEYAELSGTSMAAPHVAGVVALMWSANPALIGEVTATEQLLLTTAQPLAAAGPASPDACAAQTDLSARPNVVAGYGVVDAYAAVQAAMAWKPERAAAR